MNKYIITFISMIIICTVVNAYETVYTTKPILNYRYNNNLYRPVYNPYSRNYKLNRLNPSDMRKIRKIRMLNRLRKNAFNYLSWDIIRNMKGSLTGYSTPINQDAYQQVGINPNNKIQNKAPSNCTTDLYSLPSNDNSKYSNKGRRDNNLGGVGARTGVTIIYD